MSRTRTPLRQLYRERYAQIELEPCPADTGCGAAPGEQCRTPMGVILLMPHAPRREAAIAAGRYQP